MQMIELGRIANVFLTNGTQILFKPLEINGDQIIGTDDENFRMAIPVYDIENVIYKWKTNWR